MKIAKTFLILLLVGQLTYSHPIALFHGLDDDCENTEETWSEYLLNFSERVKCIETGASEVSFNESIEAQAQIGCNELKEKGFENIPFHVLAISQGNLIFRQMMRVCQPALQVKTYISLAGPHLGIKNSEYSANNNIGIVGSAYLFLSPLSPRIANFKSVGGYFVSSEHVDKIGKDSFIGSINNMGLLQYFKKGENLDADYQSSVNGLAEKYPKKDAIQTAVAYKEKFKNIQKLVLLKNSEEKIVLPQKSAWFGYETVAGEIQFSEQDSLWYKVDPIGIRELVEKDRVEFEVLEGKHCNFDFDDEEIKMKMRRWLSDKLK
jgi:palmitoyl-protein thioesterase